MPYPSTTNERFKLPLADITTLPETETISTSVRGISPDTYRAYGVGFYDGGILYPYSTNGKLVGYKVRHKGKRFPWDGAHASVTMFRPVTQMSGNRYLIITEGEQDAMAAYQLTGYTAWSVPFGAPSSIKYLQRALREIEMFDNIYIAFDNDKQGCAAADQAMELLDPNKAKRVTFPGGIKDFNDLLLRWESAPDAHGVKSAQDYAMRLVWGAQAPQLDGVVDLYNAANQAADWYFDRDGRVGFSTGYVGLDNLLGGWRGGDLYVLLGGTGSSKSTTARQLVMRQIENGIPSAYITLEDTVPLAITRMLEIKERRPLIVLEEPDMTRQEFLDGVASLDKLNVCDGMQMTELSTSLTRAISYYARTGVKLIVLDHLTAVSDQMPLSEFNAFMRELYRLCGHHQICLIAISHMNRDRSDSKDNEPSLARVKNSSGIPQWSTCVLGLNRDRGSNLVRLTTLKQSRTWGKTGEVWFMFNSDTQQLEESDAPLPEYDPEEDESRADRDEW